MLCVHDLCCRYGIDKVCSDHLRRMASAVMYFKDTNVYCAKVPDAMLCRMASPFVVHACICGPPLWFQFASLWRLSVDSLATDEDCDNYLSVYSRMHGLSTGPNDIVYSTDGAQILVREAVCTACAHGVCGEASLSVLSVALRLWSDWLLSCCTSPSVRTCSMHTSHRW